MDDDDEDDEDDDDEDDGQAKGISIDFFLTG